MLNSKHSWECFFNENENKAEIYNKNVKKCPEMIDFSQKRVKL